jgi:hypothetical protein
MADEVTPVGLNLLTYRVLDTMKWNKDTMRSQPSRATIDQVVTVIASMNLTHIAVAIPMDGNADYTAAGVSLPSPKTATAFTKDWFDSIHLAGKKVFFRGTSCGMEGIYDFTRLVGGDRIPVGSLGNLGGGPVTLTDHFSGTEPGSNYVYMNPSDSGNVWTVDTGELLGPAGAGWTRAILTADSFHDCTVTCKMKKTGHQELMIMATTDSNYPGYGFQTRHANTIRMERPGLEDLGEFLCPFEAYVEGNYYQLKCVVSGDNIKFKIWEDGQAEPADWLIDRSDLPTFTGKVGFSGEDNYGRFDDLVVSYDAPATWASKVWNFIVDNASIWANGDIFAPYPERTEGIFQDATSFLPGDDIQNRYVAFYEMVKEVAEAAFASIGKTVICGLTSNNYSEVNSGWIPTQFFIDAGITAVDHYGITHTKEEMAADLTGIHNSRGFDVFLQEWGDYWNQGMGETERLAYLIDFYTMLAGLAVSGILIGFNYWGGWEGSAEGILEETGGLWSLGSRGLLLKRFLDPLAVTPPPDNPEIPEPPAGETIPNYVWFGNSKVPVST